jgi:adenosylcobinamide-GDP ribazoletransferase
MSVGSESPEPLSTGSSGDAETATQSIDASGAELLWRDFRAAFSELTIFGKPADPTKLSIGRSAVFYPAVGLSMGVAVGALDWVLRTVLGQEITSVILVGALAVLSAGRQLDGFANTADGVIGFRGREWVIATIRDRRLGSSGAAAIAFLLILKVRSLDLLSDPMRFVGLLLPPMLGRAAVVAVAAGARSASASTSSGRFDPEIGPRELAVAAGFVVVVTVAFAGALGLLALIVSSLVVAALRFYYDRRLGGVTAQSLDAAAEIVETLMLILFALGS